MSKFCALTGFCTALTEDVLTTDTVACFQANKLSKALANGKHSYLVISDGIQCEYVKVTVENGKPIFIDRGVGWTDPMEWPKGTKVYFDWTDEAWADAYACLQESDEDTEECPDIKINDEVHTYVGTDENGVKCYESEEDGTIEFTSCEYKIKLKGVTFEKEEIEGLPAPGVYENAIVTWDGCRITNIKEGCKVTIGGCSPGCSCDKCTNTEPAQI